jgi:phosphomannomutase
MKEALKVGVSGVRGVVGETFTPSWRRAFAQAFGAFVGQGPVLVGRDTRPSGLMIEHAVVAGLQSVGCKPILAAWCRRPRYCC